LIRSLKPDLIIKGGDYEASDVVGSGIAKVKIFKFIKGYSTTDTIKKLNVNPQNKENK